MTFFLFGNDVKNKTRLRKFSEKLQEREVEQTFFFLKWENGLRLNQKFWLIPNAGSMNLYQRFGAGCVFSGSGSEHLISTEIFRKS